jgi:hypothetical protein
MIQGKDCREEAILLLKEHLRDSYIPRGRKLLVLFPEGGFLRKRRETSRRLAFFYYIYFLNCNVAFTKLAFGNLPTHPDTLLPTFADDT